MFRHFWDIKEKQHMILQPQKALFLFLYLFYVLSEIEPFLAQDLPTHDPHP